MSDSTYEYTYEEATRFGSARWPTDEEIKASGLLNGPGMRLGYHGNKPLMLQGDAPVIMFSGSGGGKGRDYLIPIAMEPERQIFIDPKGDLTASVIQGAASQGFEFFAWNPYSLYQEAPWFVPAHRCNLFELLTPDNPFLIDDVKFTFQQAILLSTGKSRFFEKRARQWGEGLLLYMIETTGRVVTPKEFIFLLNMVDERPKRFAEICSNEMAHSRYGIVRKTAGEMLEKRRSAASEFSGVISTLSEAFDWASSEAVLKSVSGNDFSFYDITDPARRIKIGLMAHANYMETLAPVVRILMGMLATAKDRSPGSGIVTMVVDEASQLSPPGSPFELLRKFLTYYRGKGLKSLTAWQGIGQISDSFGPGGISTFMGSSQGRLFFSVRDPETAELISHMLGTQTIRVRDLVHQAEARKRKMQAAAGIMKGEVDPFDGALEMRLEEQRAQAEGFQARKLSEPDEVMALPDDEALHFISGINLRPMKVKRYPYYTRPEYAGLYMPNPEHPPFDRVKVSGRVFKGWRTVKSGAVTADLAALPQYQLGYRSWLE